MTLLREMFDIFDVIYSGKSKQKESLNSIFFVQIVGIPKIQVHTGTNTNLEKDLK